MAEDQQMNQIKEKLESEDHPLDNESATINQGEEHAKKNDDQLVEDITGILSTLKAFVTSDNGHQLANRLIDMMEKHHKWESIPRYILTLTALCIGGWLSYEGKLDATMGVLLGSVLGYMFGKKEG